MGSTEAAKAELQRRGIEFGTRHGFQTVKVTFEFVLLDENIMNQLGSKYKEKIDNIFNEELRYLTNQRFPRTDLTGDLL